MPKEDKLGVCDDESDATEFITNSSEPKTEPVVAVEDVERSKHQRVVDLVKQMSLSAEYSTNESGMLLSCWK